MTQKPSKSSVHGLDVAASGVERWAGSGWGIGTAAATIALWLACGPLFDFSETWQLVINTATTIVTFLMVFLLQRTQNRQARATQLKLDELVAAIEGANNRLIASEGLSEAELEELEARDRRLVEDARRTPGSGAIHED